MNCTAVLNNETKKIFDIEKPNNGKKIVSKCDRERKNANSGDILAGMNQMKIDDSSKKKIASKCTQKEVDDLTTYYIDRENELLIQHYGPELYTYSKDLEMLNIPEDFLVRHRITPQVRTKMIDWMIEVLYAYNCDPPTFFLAVHILDLYIYKSKAILTDNDIHLTGIVCIYMASKMEDIIPLRMNHIKSKIGHNKFTEKDIKRKEKQILSEINFDVIATSTYDFVKTFIYDFCLNNREYIKTLKMQHHVDALDNVCVFLSKMMTLDDVFTPYKYSLKAICCIVAGFDILRSNSTTFTKNMENFIRQWILFLINESQFSQELISTVYNKLVELYQQFDNIKYLSCNLNKTHSFYFY